MKANFYVGLREFERACCFCRPQAFDVVRPELTKFPPVRIRLKRRKIAIALIEPWREF